jgi:hypothetical protein
MWHSPQFFTSDFRLDSHPSEGSSLQSPDPSLHDPVVHIPAEQPGFPFAVMQGAALQALQWSGS